MSEHRFPIERRSGNLTPRTRVFNVTVAAGGAVVDGDGSLTITVSLTGTASVDRNADGALSVTVTSVGTANVDRMGSGDRSVSVELSGTALLDVQVTGDTGITATITGTAAIDRSGEGSLGVAVGITGTASVDRAASGDLVVNAASQGSAFIEVATAGNLTVVFNGTGEAGGVNVTGDLSVAAVISGTASVDRNALGDLTVMFNGEGEAGGANASGDQSVTVLATGTALVEYALSGNLTTSVTFSGTSSVEYSATSILNVAVSITGTASVISSTPDVLGSFDDRPFMLAEALIDCICSKLETTTWGCPGRKCVAPGSEVEWANCCEDEGQLTVNLQNVFPSRNFPVPEPGPENCVTPYEVLNFEIQVIRCVPTGTHTRGPTCDQLSQTAEMTFSDLMAMRAGVRCCLQDTEGIEELASVPYFRWSFGEHISLGPEGGCVGSSLQVLVGIPICDGCA